MTQNKFNANPLNHLESWLYESLKSNATPKEVYDTLVKTIKDEIRLHKEGATKAENLLLLVKGNLSALYDKDVNGNWYQGEDLDDEAKKEKDYWEGKTLDDEFDEAVQKYGYEYTPRAPFTLDAYNAQELTGDDVIPSEPKKQVDKEWTDSKWGITHPAVPRPEEEDPQPTLRGFIIPQP